MALHQRNVSTVQQPQPQQEHVLGWAATACMGNSGGSMRQHYWGTAPTQCGSLEVSSTTAGTISLALQCAFITAGVAAARPTERCGPLSSSSKATVPGINSGG